MAYVSPNFKTKKALKDAVAARVAWDAVSPEIRALDRVGQVMTVGAVMGQSTKEPPIVEVFQPGLGTVPENGRIALEGPHYPEPHRWYATGVMENGRLVKVQ